MLYFVFLFFALLRGKEQNIGNYLCTFFLPCSLGIASQMVWECSGLTADRLYYLPGFNWTGWTRVYDARNDLGNSGRGWSYAYSIPSSGLGCTGTATAVEFCYKITNVEINNAPPDGYLVFTLSMLSQNGSSFSVEYSIPVNSRPDRVKCMGNKHWNRYFCCDSVRLLTANQFQLPAENFAFGITTPWARWPNLQRFVTKYSLELFQKRISLATGMTYSFDKAFTDELRAFRFLLSKLLSNP